MSSLDDIKAGVDLYDLATRLELQRPGGNAGNYRSPHHADKTPSLSIYHKNGRWGWTDFSDDEQGGSCIDMVMYVHGCDFGEAVRTLRDWYHMPAPELAKTSQVQQEQTLAQFIASKSRQQPERVKEYVVGRGIVEDVIDHAIKAGSLGFNYYTNPKIEPGKFGHGGPAAAFICKSQTGVDLAVDLRYLNPTLNGDVKTMSQGEKLGAPWVLDWQQFKRARTVYIVESAINALSVHSALANCTALATRGTKTVEGIDWSVCAGKRVILCMDNDKPNNKGRRPGADAAWKIYNLLIELNIGAQMLDQAEWVEEGWNDINDVLQGIDKSETSIRLKRYEQWIVPGVPGDIDLLPEGSKPRLYLPEHDYKQYWRYRVVDDFTQIIRTESDKESGEKRDTARDLCGFRIASISRVSIASPTGTLSGKKDSDPQMQFAVSVQTPRHGARLIRKVMEDEQLHNLDQWRKFGAVFDARSMGRMLSILERSAGMNERQAINFIGLCWRNGKPHINEGKDCYFTDAEHQCGYHRLAFPSGNVLHARQNIEAYRQTMQQNAATMLLTWALGAHLKLFLGFWPHHLMQAEKGAGKSTLIHRLEDSIGFTMYSPQAIATQFRMLNTVSYTSHPVGWDEVSTNKKDIIDAAVRTLQNCYQYTVSPRGSGGRVLLYLESAPVLMAGEDSQVESIESKLVRTSIDGKAGPLMPDELPRFPVREWLHYLSAFTRKDIKDRFSRAQAYCQSNCMADNTDAGAKRLVDNYAAILCRLAPTLRILGD